ncbi:hypothetical protein [Sinomonas sp. G460-2]|uniref:hypothetical protein n=1 Tax=Sinomonas sp. G460-2 TaxID=3393464 RepID=UPI0039F13825
MARSYAYTFPLVPASSPGLAFPVYGLDLGGDGAGSVVLRVGEELDRKGAFKRLSVALALLAVYEGVGLIERSPNGLGFSVAPSPDEAPEFRPSQEVLDAVHRLERSNSPYQIQACFTLSRGYALLSDPESAIIEFFKVIELYMKHLAWAHRLSEGAAKNVLVDKIILSKRVKDDLRVRAVLEPETINLIYRMKELRNRFVVHGGVRPTIAELFGDPEDYRGLLDQSAFKYDPDLHYGPTFFERTLNDLSLVGAFLFSKLQGLEPWVFVTPERSSRSSPHVRDVLEAEGARWISSDPGRLRSL